LFESANGSSVSGWAEIYQPAEGKTNFGESKITAEFENFTGGAGPRGFHIHETGILTDNCGDTLDHYNPTEEYSVGEL